MKKALVLLAAVASTASAQGSRDARNSITSIGVIALLSNEFHLRYEAPTAFGNEEYTDRAPQWRIDEFVAEAAAMILARRGISDVSVFDGADVTWRKSGRLSSYDPIFDIAERQRYDTVAIILPFARPVPKYYEGGYGLLVRNKSPFGEPGTQCAFSWLIIELWDVDARKKLESEHALACHQDESIEIRERLSDYRPVEQVQIEQLIKASLLGSTTIAARKLNLEE